MDDTQWCISLEPQPAWDMLRRWGLSDKLVASQWTYLHTSDFSRYWKSVLRIDVAVYLNPILVGIHKWSFRFYFENQKFLLYKMSIKMLKKNCHQHCLESKKFKFLNLYIRNVKRNWGLLSGKKKHIFAKFSVF